jgi:hypothetical protein
MLHLLRSVVSRLTWFSHETLDVFLGKVNQSEAVIIVEEMEPRLTPAPRLKYNMPSE